MKAASIFVLGLMIALFSGAFQGSVYKLVDVDRTLVQTNFGLPFPYHTMENYAVGEKGATVTTSILNPVSLAADWLFWALLIWLPTSEYIRIMYHNRMADLREATAQRRKKDEDKKREKEKAKAPELLADKTVSTLRDLQGEHSPPMVEKKELLNALADRFHLSAPDAEVVITQLLKEGIIIEPKEGYLKTI